MDKYNIHEKIIKISIELKEKKIEKRGKVSYGKSCFHYFKLEDFQTELLKLFNKYKVAAYFNFLKDSSKLTILNIEDPSQSRDFSIEHPDLSLEDMQGIYSKKVQELGGKTTYLKRYLFLIAFYIDEEDIIEIKGSDQGSGMRKDEELKMYKKELSQFLSFSGIKDENKAEFLNRNFAKEMQNKQYCNIISNLEKNGKMITDFNAGINNG